MRLNKLIPLLLLLVCNLTASYAQSTRYVVKTDSITKKFTYLLITRKGDTISPDSLRKAVVTDAEVTNYLKLRPSFGDTTGKTSEIKQLLKNVQWLMAFQCDAYSDALAWAEEEKVTREKVNKVLVLKSKRRMYLMKGTDTVFTFKINLGPNPIGQKEREGDGRTPEGIYKLDWTRSFEPTFLSYHINYPSPADIARAKQKGLTVGKDIMVHAGGTIPRTKRDWTNGCIALTNTDMVVFAKYVALGDPIEIRK